MFLPSASATMTCVTRKTPSSISLGAVAPPGWHSDEWSPNFGNKCYHWLFDVLDKTLDKKDNLNFIENDFQCWYKKSFMLTMVNIWSIMCFCVTKTLVQISRYQRRHWKKMKRQQWSLKDIKKANKTTYDRWWRSDDEKHNLRDGLQSETYIAIWDGFCNPRCSRQSWVWRWVLDRLYIAAIDHPQVLSSHLSFEQNNNCAHNQEKGLRSVVELTVQCALRDVSAVK